MKSFQCVETVEGYKFRSEGFRVRCNFQLRYNSTAGASEAECATNAGKVLRPAGELVTSQLCFCGYNDSTLLEINLIKSVHP